MHADRFSWRRKSLLLASPSRGRSSLRDRIEIVTGTHFYFIIIPLCDSILGLLLYRIVSTEEKGVVLGHLVDLLMPSKYPFLLL